MSKLKYGKTILTFLLLVGLIGCEATPTNSNHVFKVKKGHVVYSSTTINEQLVKEAIENSKFSVEQRNDAIVIIMPVKNSFNAKRQDVLLPVTLAPLSNIAKLVKQDKNTVIVIVGHTDNRGNPLTNTDLSKRRAKSVRSVFSVMGVNTSNLFATGVGDNQPLNSNKTVKERDHNQRVEILIVQKQNRDLSTLPDLYAATHFKKNI